MDNGKTIICRCEEVTLEEIVRAASEHQCSARDVKLWTRAGMGFCGGRTCRMLVDAIVREAGGLPGDDEIPLKYQPPARPVTFAVMGGIADGIRQN